MSLKNELIFIIYLVSSFVSLWAFDQEMPNVKTPTNLEQNEGEFTLTHRFDHTGDNTFAISGANAYAFGFAILTYGHQFLLEAGNSIALDTRRLMLGTDTSRIFVGFNIKRHFDLNE